MSDSPQQQTRAPDPEVTEDLAHEIAIQELVRRTPWTAPTVDRATEAVLRARLTVTSDPDEGPA